MVDPFSLGTCIEIVDRTYYFYRNGWMEGWYHIDEAEQLNGPYKSLEDCKQAYETYVKNL